MDCYITPRGQRPRSTNLLDGGQTDLFGSDRDGFELLGKAHSPNKNIFVVSEATYYDFYDRPRYVQKAVEQPKSFLAAYL